MEIRDFSNELLKYLTEHLNVYKVSHNLSEVWDEKSFLPIENPKYFVKLKSNVSEGMIVEIEDFIHIKSSRIPYMVEEYAPNVVKIEGIYYPLT